MAGRVFARLLLVTPSSFDARFARSLVKLRGASILFNEAQLFIVQTCTQPREMLESGEYSREAEWRETSGPERN